MPKDIHIVRWTEQPGPTEHQLFFRSAHSAAMAAARLAKNPSNRMLPVTTAPIHGRAPASNRIEAGITISGTIRYTQGPFPSMAAHNRPHLAEADTAQTQLTYSGPAKNTTEGRTGAQHLHETMTAKGLWPKDSRELAAWRRAYGALPWWLQLPPLPLETDTQSVWTSLLVCADCSLHLTAVPTPTQHAAYTCPGAPDHPGCPSNPVPPHTIKRFIATLIATAAQETSIADVASAIRDPELENRSLALHLLQAEEHDHHLSTQMQEKYQITQKFNGIRETLDQERAQLRKTLKACAEHGNDPLWAIEPLADAEHELARHLFDSFSILQLLKPKEGPATDWLKNHVRLAETANNQERIHYRRPMGPQGILHEAADSHSYIHRVLAPKT